MPTVDVRDLPIGHLYAASILDLAEEARQGEAIAEELAELVRAIDASADFARFLGSPLIDVKLRAELLEGNLRGQASDLLVDSLLVINRKGRLSLLPAIAEAYRRELRRRRGLIDARVTTAVPLSPALKAKLTESLRRFSGREPLLVEKVDPRLLGGTVVEIGGQKIDTSIASQLRELSHTLLDRASSEILSGKSYLAE
jgi:F-type H+-transporting ATPase subunit delta